MPDPTNVFAYNRYMYVRGNPLHFTDSSGHYWETAVDVASVGYGIYDIQQNGLNWGNGLSLVADVGSVLLPIPGPGACIHFCDDALHYGAKAVNWIGNKVDNGLNAAKHWTNGSDIAGSVLGAWARHNEIADPLIAQQLQGNWCVLACGQMLTNGRVAQQKLSQLVTIMPGGTDPTDVAAAMNILDSGATGMWKGGYVGPDVFGALNNTGSWAAMMKIDGGHHMIVVDGVNDAGMVMIRDPYAATRYNMSLDEFHNYWTGNAIFGN